MWNRRALLKRIPFLHNVWQCERLSSVREHIETSGWDALVQHFPPPVQPADQHVDYDQEHVAVDYAELEPPLVEPAPGVSSHALEINHAGTLAAQEERAHQLLDQLVGMRLGPPQ